MRSIILMSGLSLALLFTACGKKELSDAEKAKFRETLSAVGQVPSAAVQADKMKKQNGFNNAAAELAVQHHPFIKMLAATGIAGQQEPSAKQREMAEALAKADCNLKIDLPVGISGSMMGGMGGGGGMSLPPSQTVKMLVEGANCPMSMSLVVTINNQMSQTGGSMNGTFDWTFGITNPEFKKYSDVQSVSIKGSFNMSAKGDQQGNGSANGDLNIEGKVTSQTDGEITMYVKANLNVSGSQGKASGKTEARLGAKYPGKFDAELAMIVEDINKPDSIKYTINDKTISQQEFNDFFNGIDKSTIPTQGGGSPGSYPGSPGSSGFPSSGFPTPPPA